MDRLSRYHDVVFKQCVVEYYLENQTNSISTIVSHIVLITDKLQIPLVKKQISTFFFQQLNDMERMLVLNQ